MGRKRMGKTRMNWKKTGIFSFLLLLWTAGAVYAAAPGAVVSSEVTGDEIVLYVQSPGEVEDIRCQVGTVLCDEIVCESVIGQELPVSTLLLMDNSLSVAQKYRPVIQEIMNNLAANRLPNETVTVATFSDKLTVLLEDSKDYVQIKQAIDGITYEDQDTYLTDVLYELLKDWENNSKPGYKRIVLVSDGVDNNVTGYTKEELYDLIKEHPYPVYTLGCTYKNSDNSGELKNMFALSRLTQAESWLLDEVPDPMTVVNGVAAGNQILRISVTPPPEVCDGTPKGVKLSLTAGGSQLESTTVVNMPFGNAAQETEPESGVTETEVTPETETVPETESVSESNLKTVRGEEQSGEKWYENPKVGIYIVIVGFIVLIIIAIIVVLVRLIKQRKEDEFEMAPVEAFRQAAVQSGSVKNIIEETELVPGTDDNNTAMVWGAAGRMYTLVLTDQNNPARSFEVPLSGTVVIGRSQKSGCQIVLDYDKSVSHRHCQITMESGKVKVSDLGSRNGTILDGKRVIGDAELSGGSILTLGNLKMKVEIR